MGQLRSLIKTSRRSFRRWPCRTRISTRCYPSNCMVIGLLYAPPIWGGDSFFENSSRVGIGRSGMGLDMFWPVKSYWGKEIGCREPWAAISEQNEKRCWQKSALAWVQQGGPCSEESIAGSEGSPREMGPKLWGPFVVKRAFSRRALLLMNMDDEELPLPMNSDVVKRYYA